MSYLIDSDWLADYLRGRPAATQLLEQLLPSGLAISIITYAEIYEGILYGDQRQRHEQGLNAFVRVARVLAITRPVARLRPLG
jgi:tRNA(fMet)-specific endonuclease VapC